MGIAKTPSFAMMKVLLSSTSKDLVEYRKAVHDAIHRMDDWKCIRMEDFGARDDAPDEFCRQQASNADVVVGIVGHCYGSIPSGSDKSFTEREYESAVAANVPRLMFLAPEDFPLAASLHEPDDLKEKQRRFRNRVRSDRMLSSFESPLGLAVDVVTALRNWERSSQSATPSEPDRGEIARTLIESLNTSSFYAMAGEFGAANFIRLIAAPIVSHPCMLDDETEKTLRVAVRQAFPEVRRFHGETPRGQFYQMFSRDESRSSSYRLWSRWDSGPLGYVADLGKEKPIAFGDLVLHYIFFLRLCRLVWSPEAEIVLEAGLVCPNIHFSPYVPDPQGSPTDYDQITCISFKDRHPWLREQIRSIRVLKPGSRLEHELANLLMFQIKEVAAARVNLTGLQVILRGLVDQTESEMWGKTQ